MEKDLAATIARLERIVLQQAAEIGQLREENRRLLTTNEALLHERDELREELQEAQRLLRKAEMDRDAGMTDMRKLLHAIQHADERLMNLIRKQFVASSERAHIDQNILPEILDYCVAEGLMDPEEAAGCGNDTNTGKDADSEDEKKGQGNKRHKRPKNAGGRKPLPAHLERRESTYDVPADHPALAVTESHEIIGWTQIERVQLPNCDVFVEVLRCPIARAKLPGGHSCRITLTPPSIIERGQVSDRFLTQSIVDKVVDYLPANRQEKRLARQEIDLPRNKICRWHTQAGIFFNDLAEAILSETLRQLVVGIDDSVHRLRIDGQATCKQGRMWAVASPLGVFYFFSTTRESKWITDLLNEFSGAVMGDAYVGHNEILARPHIIALFCWAHVRRKFFESADTKRKKIMLALIGELYAIEDDLKNLEARQRAFQRAARSRPILTTIRQQLDAWTNDPGVLPKSGIGKATSYTLKLWDGLIAYVGIGEAPIDNNHTERAMRPNALHRKNSLFSASIAGAKSYATLMTVTQSALINGLNPVTYLNDVVEDIHYRRHPIRELTPAAYARRMETESKLSS